MIQRKAVRAVIMTPDHRVLLIKFKSLSQDFSFGLRPAEAWNPVSLRKKDCGEKSLKRLAL